MSVITVSTNLFGRVSPDDPEPGPPNDWKAPTTVSSYLHHDARFEMRSRSVSGGHGNQACYNENGQLILKTIAGGTADYAYASLINATKHVPEDVLPFLRAVWLDGNPGQRTILNDITRPCVYEGDNIARYIECRPVTEP